LRGLPDNLDVLRRRDFRLLLGAQGVSVLGDRMVAVALAFAVLELGGSPSEVGLVLAAGTVPLVATVLIGGVVADRVSRKGVMVVADVVRVATQGAMAVLLIAGAAEVWTLALLAGLTGVASGFFNPASTAILPEVVPDDELQRANALRTTAISGSEIAGPVLAGLLVAAAGAGWAIAADAATFAVSALCLFLLRLAPRPERAPSSFVADLREGWVAFSSRRWLWSSLLYFGAGNMLWAAWSALGPVVADRELGGADAWGLVLGGFGAGMLLGGVLAIRVDPERPLVLVALMEGLFMLPLVFLAAGSPVPLLFVGSLLSGVGMTIGMSVWISTLQRHVPGESLSRVSSYDWFASYAFYPIGLALWGPVAEGLGVTPALWLAAGLMGASIVALLAFPDVRALDRRAPQAVAGAPSG
jgi:MFS family permease